jgi:hypothetical protein
MKHICDKKMTFNDCELAILRAAVDEAENKQGQRITNSPEIKRIIDIVANFLRKKQLICYGGTAINNILPKQDQFYNKEVEIPDYDFYSNNALKDAKELADIYFSNGFEEVEAKTGQHHGTYKVFVNFIPVADITYIPKELFNAIKKEAIKVSGILYSPPNLLRMNMYLELSRPAGDISRWEKVLKRLVLLNKNYPLVSKQCSDVNFQRKMENNYFSDKIYEIVQQTLIDQGVVFFGGYALSLYSRYMPKDVKRKLEKIPDFDVLSEEPLLVAEVVKERLNDEDIKHVKIIKRPGIGEIIAPHYEIKVNNDTIVFIYEPLACHSYNIVKDNGEKIKIATIDTMLSFWLAFLYVNRPYYDKDRILCMSNYLFDVQEKNRLAQKGLLKRFSISCMGHQQTIEEMRAEKSEKYSLLKDKPNSNEYEEWFLRYRPSDKEIKGKGKCKGKGTKPEDTETKDTETKDTKTKRKARKNNKTKKRKGLGIFF